jgi:tetratricopeptide (TPR) repeat protein
MIGMKKYFFVLLATGALQSHAQQPTNPQAQLTPRQKAMMKQMGIDASDPKKAAAQIKQLKQQGQMPDFNAQGQSMINNMMVSSGTKTTKTAGDFGYFTNNASLVPERDLKRINSISKKIFSSEEMLSNTKLLYNKMLAKLPAAEKSIITSVTAQQTSGAALNSASVTAMMQGHRLAALGLAMQAVMARPGNLNYQNNMAALLTENGYPENAIPYLNTLQQQVPANSTVKNNLGYAWLNLGEIDSAQRILTAAAALNPENAETETGEGVIQEKKGNTEEAGKHYEEAFVEAPSPLILNVLNNAGKANPYDKMTFDEIKDKITIYEYFKKDWVTFPDLSNSVDGYQSDIAIQNGYHKMFENLLDKLQEVEDSIKNAKDGDLFIPSSKGTVNGHILIAISSYFGPFLADFYKEGAEMEDYVKGVEEDTYKQAAKIDPNNPAKCQIEHDLWNSYLKQVNPIIKEFYLKKHEKMRVWINAFITYSLLTNHQYKKHLLDVVYYVKRYLSLADVIELLKVLTPTCGNQTYNTSAITKVDDHQLPKLLCPININANSASNNNNNNISKSATCTAPNATVAIGSAEGEIAEPGKAGTPSVSTSQGDVSSKGINQQDEYGNFKQSIEKVEYDLYPLTFDKGVDDLHPLTFDKEVDDLTPLSKIIEKDDLHPLTFDKEEDDLAPLVKIIEKHNLKKWLQNQLGTDCDDLKKRDPNEEMMKLIDAMEAADELKMDKQNLQKKLDQLNQQNNPANAQEIESGNKIMEAITKGQQCIEQKKSTNPGWADKYGLSPTINNGLQTQGSNTSFIKGLFN